MTLRRIFHIFLFLTLVLAAVYLRQTLKRPDVFPIQTVRIEGDLTQLSREELQSAASPFVNTGFFAFSPNELREHLLSIPWVQSANITRYWPDTVAIAVSEKKAIARWGDDGIVTASGEVFFPDNNTIPENLPVFIGPPAMTNVMVQHFDDMQTKLKAIGLSVKELGCSSRHAWTAVLNNDIRLELGRSDIQTRVDRFVKAYHKIVRAHVESIEQIDLRYNNGLAVKWKEARI